MGIIQTEDVTKYFGKVTAAKNVSIEVKQGEIYGFLGLNGAGKTTLIRMLLGMIKPNNGSIKLFGKEVNAEFNRWNDIGYLVETPFAYPELSVQENLEIYFRLRDLRENKKITGTIEKLQLGKYKNTKAKHLSLGNLQKLGLAKAFMHSPELLILDEPINSLDPAGIVEIRELLREMSNNGCTIFISSHILGEIAKIANRIAIIHEGKIIKEQPVKELDKELLTKVIINTNNNKKACIELEKNGYSQIQLRETHIELLDDHAVFAPEKISQILAKSDLPVKEIKIDTEDLEKYFLRLLNFQN